MSQPTQKTLTGQKHRKLRFVLDAVVASTLTLYTVAFISGISQTL